MRSRSLNMVHGFALVCASVLLAGSVAYGKELLDNRKFKKGAEDWSIAYHDGKEDDSVDIDGGVLRLRAWPRVAPNYVRLMQPVKAKEGKTYTVSFDARVEALGKSEDRKEGSIIVAVQRKGPDWESYGLREKIVLEAEWKTYTYTFTCTEIHEENEPVLRFHVGQAGGNIFFRGISMVDK